MAYRAIKYLPDVNTGNRLFSDWGCGTFKLSRRFIDQTDPSQLIKALDGMFVTKCEFNFVQDCFVYEAYSLAFEKIDVGFEPPEYSLKIFTENSNYVNTSWFKWVKC